MNDVKKDWYTHGWGLAGAVLLFPLFFIWYTWNKTSWSRNTKIAVTVGIGIVLLATSTNASNQTNPAKQDEAAPSAQNEPSTEPQTIKSEEPPLKAEYKGLIVRTSVINPATLSFVAQVSNTGTAPGKFNCTVRAQDESRTYKGFDFFTDEEDLPPGETRTFSGVLTITKEGAYYATESSISCT